MENKNKRVKAGFSTILWTVTVILLCAAPCVWAEWQEVTYEGEGVVANISEPFEGIVYVNNGAELNLLAGGYISDSLNAQEGGTVNIKGGGVGFYVSAIAGAEVTVYGTDFAVDGAQYETPASVIIPYGTLTGKYEDGSDINLVFMSDIPIHLAAPPAGGPTPIYIDIKPGSYPNSINLGSQGVIPVAILSTAELDATTLNAENTFLAGSGVRVRGKGNKYLASEEDVNGDGLIDLVVKVETENLDPGQFAEGGAYLWVHETSDPTSAVLYEGWDEIRIVPPE